MEAFTIEVVPIVMPVSPTTLRLTESQNRTWKAKAAIRGLTKNEFLADRLDEISIREILAFNEQRKSRIGEGAGRRARMHRLDVDVARRMDAIVADAKGIDSRSEVLDALIGDPIEA